MDIHIAGARFLDWLDRQILVAGRGDDLTKLDVEPSGRFWLGRLAPEAAVIALGLGDRGERLDPCAVGLVVRPKGSAPWTMSVRLRCCAWLRERPGEWKKSPAISVSIDIALAGPGEQTHGAAKLADALADVVGQPVLSAELRTEALTNPDGTIDLTVTLVNTSPHDHPQLCDTNLYECSLELSGLETRPFLLEALPDSFRYDRRIDAYGVNCGVVLRDDVFATADTIVVNRGRPSYWNTDDEAPDLSFKHLAKAPLGSLEALVQSHAKWGDATWGTDSLTGRAKRDLWSTAMADEAKAAAADFAQEQARLAEGVELLRAEPTLLRAFKLMNEAIAHSSHGKYESWRPFQIGFLLANLKCIASPSSENEVADIVWFATGGGKTETYLGLLVTASLYDRMTGKLGGLTAWSRFPLRMLSLQQTQRFANAMAGAEVVRRRENIPGASFSVGFLVGQGATPNRLKENPNQWEPDPTDAEMPAKFQVLTSCPFCHEPSIEMGFNRRQWRLEHRCNNDACEWPETALPFLIVDEEIYRFLPTVIVGTLDKAASISLQASMRGLVGPPLGKCTGPEHGYLYAPRKSRPHGCLVPGCRAKPGPLEQPPERFGPSFRLQDELHLLKDSLGAVDAHYEALLDHLQHELTGAKPKILASSATLTGYQKQVDVLYQRDGRVFPVPGPSSKEGFWTTETEALARRFVAVAPRGVTLEYAVDRTITELQRAVRSLRDDPAGVCKAAAVPDSFAAELLSLYGTNVVYGNTLRDLDATTRSLETQVPVKGRLNAATLTGRTEFDEVRQVLDRLDHPEAEFDDRIHVIAASSMMSHGVDVDRLNAMVVLGLPLTTAEFIQATARVGRRYPGIVYVMHKIARERDASVHRAFESFVSQGDRFVEAVPVTRHSRKVLERTIAGMQLARNLALHEAGSGRSLAIVRALRSYFQDEGITAAVETQALVEALGLGDPLDEKMREDVERWVEQFFRNLMDPAGTVTFPSDLCPWGPPMISLRDVEEQVPILGRLR
ncbi:MAG: hypothetical protein KF729_12245 [Sandaracinaceae bacterium]|nr:hypothetical protein [Sandaracinaceae bacterium]